MKGKIYGLFKVEEKENGFEMVDNFFNNHFFWLFLIMDSIEAFACWCLGIPHNFIIKIKKD